MKSSGPQGRLPRVQFISKPMDPPYRDGSKCLVRDLCHNLRTVEPHVLSSRAPLPELGPDVIAHPAYSQVGSYRPLLLQNAQAALWTAIASRAELWHFVFAPNPVSSRVARGLRRLRRVPTLQTIASPPRSFDDPRSLLFGDLVIAQSEWTRRKMIAAAKSFGQSIPEIIEIPPSVPVLPHVSWAEEERVRAQLGLENRAPLLVYPGDLEVSRGAARAIEWAPEVRKLVPEVRVVIAYRQKTPHAAARAAELRRCSDPSLVLFAQDIDNIHALLQTAAAIVFPVEDLYGKVDLPIVLLEALALKTPVLALDEGPLGSLEGALRLPLDPIAWIAQASRIIKDPLFRSQWSDQGTQAVLRTYSADRVCRQYEDVYARLLS